MRIASINPKYDCLFCFFDHNIGVDWPHISAYRPFTRDMKRGGPSRERTEEEPQEEENRGGRIKIIFFLVSQ